jgi:hypothetical protein
MIKLLSAKWIFISAILLTLCSCAAGFREHKYGQGYVVLHVEDERYRIEYFAKSKQDAAKYWGQTFDQLCQGGGRIIYEEGEVVNRDMYTPIMGQSVNIGRQKFHHIGEVECHKAGSDLLKLTQSPWREFNSHTQQQTPVSEEYILRKLNVYINHFSNLQPAKPYEQIAKIWGKPSEKKSLGSENFYIWNKGGVDSVASQFLLVEEKDCLKAAMIIPLYSGYLLAALEKSNKMTKLDYQEIMTSGLVPTYFLTNSNCNKIP